MCLLTNFRVLTHETTSTQELHHHHHDSVSYDQYSRHQEAIQSLDPMLACKQPNKGSGATAIGSTARTPDERQTSDAKLQTIIEDQQLEHIDHQLHSCLDRSRLR